MKRKGIYWRWKTKRILKRWNTGSEDNDRIEGAWKAVDALTPALRADKKEMGLASYSASATGPPRKPRIRVRDLPSILGRRRSVPSGKIWRTDPAVSAEHEGRDRGLAEHVTELFLGESCDG